MIQFAEDSCTASLQASALVGEPAASSSGAAPSGADEAAASIGAGEVAEDEADWGSADKDTDVSEGEEGGDDDEPVARPTLVMPVEPTLEDYTTVASFGITDKLTNYVRIGFHAFVHMLPLLRAEFGFPPRFDHVWANMVVVAVDALAAEHENLSGEEVQAIAENLRRILFNMVCQRRQVLDSENKRRQVPLDQLGSIVLTDTQVEEYMREHRRAFDASRAQTLFCKADENAGLPHWQVIKRLDNRHSSHPCLTLSSLWPGWQAFLRPTHSLAHSLYCLNVSGSTRTCWSTTAVGSVSARSSRRPSFAICASGPGAAKKDPGRRRLHLRGGRGRRRPERDCPTSSAWRLTSTTRTEPHDGRPSCWRSCGSVRRNGPAWANSGHRTSGVSGISGVRGIGPCPQRNWRRCRDHHGGGRSHRRGHGRAGAEGSSDRVARRFRRRPSVPVMHCIQKPTEKPSRCVNVPRVQGAYVTCVSACAAGCCSRKPSRRVFMLRVRARESGASHTRAHTAHAGISIASEAPRDACTCVHARIHRIGAHTHTSTRMHTYIDARRLQDQGAQNLHVRANVHHSMTR